MSSSSDDPEGDPEADRPGPRITVIGDDRPKPADLTDLTTEAQMEDAMRKGVPRGKYDPNWKPKRAKGEKINRETDEYMKAAEAAVRGLPALSRTTWYEVQLFDNGEAAGRRSHTRYVLKITATTANAGALMAEDRRALSVTRHCLLSTPANFIRNLRRKKDRHALTKYEWEIVRSMHSDISQMPVAEGQPETLMGALSTKLHGEGTVRSVGQFAHLAWEMGGEEWMPVVQLVQYFPRESDAEATVMTLGPPPVVKPGRKPTACRWYYRAASEEFAALMERAKDPSADLRDRIKQMKEKKT